MRSALILAAALGLLALEFSTPALARAPTDRVLGMRVEGVDLSAKDRDDLFQVVQTKLRLYPTLTLLKPPEEELTDIMLDLECFEIDVECLTKLGSKYGSTKVFYAQVDPGEGGFMLRVSIVDVTTGQAVRQRESLVTARADLAGALEHEVEAVFGKPPPPKPAEGTLVVEAGIPGAQIFIDGTYAGTGRVGLKKRPGTYNIRVAREGYTEALFQLVVTAGKTVQRRVTLEPLPEPPEGTPVPPVTGEGEEEEEETAVYETWWFWTAIVGGAALASAAIAVPIVLSNDSAPAPAGEVSISLEGLQAWRDSAIRSGGQ